MPVIIVLSLRSASCVREGGRIATVTVLSTLWASQGSTVQGRDISQYTTVYHSIPQYIISQVTVDTNHPVVSLRALFPSLLPVEEEGGPQNAMGFRLLAGPEVTIVASKSSGNEGFSV